jgi:hypothetical protein
LSYVAPSTEEALACGAVVLADTHAAASVDLSFHDVVTFIEAMGPCRSFPTAINEEPA